jgi:L-seryl-tRNA(Ser) seleniumtransferase
VIPSIEQMRQRASVAALEAEFGHDATLDALRQSAEQVRAAIAGGREFDSPDAAATEIERVAAAALTREIKGSLRRVINATGVVIHTNLGRAPLAVSAVQRVAEIAAGYCNLEYDLEQGGRGSRSVHAESLLTTLTGAEAAVVVNNNAAATMLILASLGAGREVLISRGELVEIGGGFRVPDVMAQSGAVLREVGTTNRTRVGDYRAAIGARTAMLLRVHPSNFRIEGFTERPSLQELVAAAHDAGIPLVEDLGSGRLDETLEWEPAVQRSIAAGADLVCFSGDKMLGGPQAGIIVGRAALVKQLQRHPLMRAVRVDKLTLAALEATLIEYRAGRAHASIPVVRMLRESIESVETRAQHLVEQLHSARWRVALMSGTSAAGGGSAPGVDIPTILVALQHATFPPHLVERRLRGGDPPIIARIEDDCIVLDLRTVLPEDDHVVFDALLKI